jgi:hypothetical protein
MSLFPQNVFLEVMGERDYDDNSSVASCTFSEEEGLAEVEQIALELRHSEVALVEYANASFSSSSSSNSKGRTSSLFSKAKPSATTSSMSSAAKAALQSKASTCLIGPLRRIYYSYILVFLLNCIAFVGVCVPLLSVFLNQYNLYKHTHIGSVTNADARNFALLVAFSSLAFEAIVKLTQCICFY